MQKGTRNNDIGNVATVTNGETVCQTAMVEDVYEIPTDEAASVGSGMSYVIP